MRSCWAVRQVDATSFAVPFRLMKARPRSIRRTRIAASRHRPRFPARPGTFSTRRAQGDVRSPERSLARGTTFVMDHNEGASGKTADRRADRGPRTDSVRWYETEIFSEPRFLLRQAARPVNPPAVQPIFLRGWLDAGGPCNSIGRGGRMAERRHNPGTWIVIAIVAFALGVAIARVAFINFGNRYPMPTTTAPASRP